MLTAFSYIYDATGRKVRKVIRDNLFTQNKVTDYAHGFQYLDHVIQHFPTAEGYVSRLNLRQENGVVALLPSTELPVDFFTYVYNYTDHLGNIRLSYAQDPDTQQLKIVEQNHYYPFGLRHTNYSGGKMQVVKEQEFKRMAPTPEELLSYKYKYNGKEYQDELGQNVYAYGWRDYDPAIGRFIKMDRFAEKYYMESPYHYGGNNPVFFVDIKGDSLNVGRFRNYDKDANDQFMNDMMQKTGLTLITDDDGNVTYEMKDGKAVVSKDENGKDVGSKSARKALMKLIKSKQTVTVDGTSGLTKTDMDGADPNLILINPAQTYSEMRNTSPDLNSTTNGFALTFFHELGHTKYGGRGQDPPFVEGQNGYLQAGRQERLPNRIRREMGNSYGQRMTYFPYYVKSEGNSYYPWTATSLEQLKNNQTPTSGFILAK